MARVLSVAFVLPYGEPRESFFPDVIAELCARRAIDLGHTAHVVRVHYDGRDPARDAAVRGSLEDWLATRNVDVVVVERLFDPAPIQRHVRALDGRHAVLMSWGDAEPIEGIELVVGLTPGLIRRATTRRSPSGGELVEAFGGLLDALANDAAVLTVPGVARFDGTRITPGPPGRAAKLPRPFQPVVEHDVIGEAPPITRKFVLGNAGCPYGDDPAENPFYRGLPLASDGSLSRLGCAFCHAGGDYQKRDDHEVIDEIVEQARFYQEHVPGLAELVLIDQHPLRYLARLIEAVHTAGLRPTRWLFAARADSFVREQQRVREAVAAARATGQTVEVYLSGFESFSERELSRYNKGVGVADMLAAVGVMRALRRENEGAFEHARARGHSLILWSPWTTPEDLADSVEAIRAHGLTEIFSELGRNRLRLYRELPIFHAAERDGALTDTWDAGDEGAGRRKGYAVEHPWRFLDPRTRLAYALALGLRDRLGTETEVSQLAATAAHARTATVTDVEQQTSRILSGVDALADRLLKLARGRSRGPSVNAAAVRFAGACDNACASCSNRDRWLEDERVLQRIEEARAKGLPIALAGREPSLHVAFFDLVAAARGDDGRDVGVVTNGRSFATPEFARRAVEHGLRVASVKVFAPDAASADEVAGVLGAHQQTLLGIAALRNAGVGLELRVALSRASFTAAERFVELAIGVEVPRLRVEVALDALGLDRLGAAVDALDRLAARCHAAGVSLDASPLSSGTGGFGRLPR